ncbi:hypothetical protein [Bradyrhizobium sp. WU425]|uniref:hypothetical protein n=1 Tax=Bradyrhizobium sp. WU425 TaxID=187029 RepID=UPI001E549DC7|nr:hypothetical protein [Bradyrhizobium canariense]UFW75218.1 hypothetical protein BcanWU425_16185 [Bradyrhizobium canariense]
MIKIISIVLLTALLGGCASRGPGSIAGGECKIFEAPPYEVRGARAYDQDWIDSQVEGGVGGCRWKRPAARPASIDAAPVRKATPAPVKRKSLVRRIRDRVLPAKVEAPAVPLESVPTLPIVTPPAPRPPRSAIERLLQPRDDD